MPQALIKRLFPLVIVLTLVLSACGAPPDTVRVSRVIDGDTIVIEGNYRVRYLGIDTPELYPVAEPYAHAAWQANQRLVAGKRVRLERDVSDTDRYGRWLRYVYLDGEFVNAALVREGLARARAYPPDTRYQALLEKAEREARRAGRGIWAK